MYYDCLLCGSEVFVVVLLFAVYFAKLEIHCMLLRKLSHNYSVISIFDSIRFAFLLLFSSFDTIFILPLP